MILHYNQRQQITILNNCKTAKELLEIKEFLEELQFISKATQIVYDRMMDYFLSNNKIDSYQSKI